MTEWLINMETGPITSAHIRLKSRIVYAHLEKHLQSRFEIELLPMTMTISVKDNLCLSHFESNVKNYTIASIGDYIRLDFMSKFDYDKGLTDEQVEFLKSNDVEIEIIKNMLELTTSVEDLESLADKITLLADFLKDFE